MIEIKTDWSFQKTELFLDGIPMPFVKEFKISLNADGPLLEITKYQSKDGDLIMERKCEKDACIAMEKLYFTCFKITQL